jgi:methionyl aminopeptidase
MITLKSPRELEAMTHAGRIVGGTLALLRRETRAGHSTEDLDRMAEAFIRSHPGATPSFKGLYGFPKTLCTSINEEIVHGIPSTKRVLREGNIVSVDVGVHFEGMHADSATTIAVGEVSPEAQRLLAVTQECLAAGIAAARLGNHVETSATRCRAWRRRRATAWCGSWSGTASGRASTRSRRCRTTASRSGAPGSSRG